MADAKPTPSRVLTEEQQDALDAQKVALRIENERYLRAHPELQTMLSSFMASVLRDRPDDVVKHAVAFFHTHPQLHDAAQ